MSRRYQIIAQQRPGSFRARPFNNVMGNHPTLDRRGGGADTLSVPLIAAGDAHLESNIIAWGCSWVMPEEWWPILRALFSDWNFGDSDEAPPADLDVDVAGYGGAGWSFWTALADTTYKQRVYEIYQPPNPGDSWPPPPS